MKLEKIKKLIEDLIIELVASPFDVYGASQENLEREYLKQLQGSYVRTIVDIVKLYPQASEDIKILEIGAYQGIVAIALSILGYSVSVFDIPDILLNNKLQEKYNLHHINFLSGDLSEKVLPFEDNYFDIIIICEVIEHLNFTPIPALKEMNRVNKFKGFIYVGMPNQLRFWNRVRAIFGYSILPPVSELIRLSNDPTFRVGLHWREYTMMESIELLEHVGYQIFNKYFYSDQHNHHRSAKNLIKSFINLTFHSLKPNLVVIGRKY